MEAFSELRELPAHIQQIRDGLEDLFKNLPRNKRVAYIGVSSFTMKMSQLTGGKNLCPLFYDYEFQHNKLKEFIQEYPLDSIEKKLIEICTTGKIVRSETVWLHPEVLEFIRAACGYQGAGSNLEPESMEERRG